MLRHTLKLCTIALVACAPISIQAASDRPSPEETPEIPIAALETYKASIIEEKLETMILPRLQLIGRRTLLSDPLINHVSIPTDGRCSARFELRNAPEITVEFLTFPSNAFEHALTDATLNRYLAGLSRHYSPQQAFKVIEPAAFSENGPARFRILGQRAHTIRYGFLKDQTPYICGENWIERDGTLHIVRIQTPARAFESEFNEVKATLNSMIEVK